MKQITLIVIGAIFVLGAMIGCGIYFGYNNDEIALRNEAEAQRSKVEGVHDKMWKIIQQKAGVTQEYAESFDSIYTHIISGRYDSGDGTLMKWIKESNPQFDSSLYKDLSESIEVYRTEFQKSQERMIDIIREHTTMCTTYPGKWVISNTTPIEYTVISSSRSKVVMETGIDDDVTLFN